MSWGMPPHSPIPFHSVLEEHRWTLMAVWVPMWELRNLPSMLSPFCPLILLHDGTYRIPAHGHGPYGRSGVLLASENRSQANQGLGAPA